METGKSVSPMKNRPKHLPASGGFCVSAKRLRRFAEKEGRCGRTKQIRLAAILPDGGSFVEKGHRHRARAGMGAHHAAHHCLRQEGHVILPQEGAVRDIFLQEGVV